MNKPFKLKQDAPRDTTGRYSPKPGGTPGEVRKIADQTGKDFLDVNVEVSVPDHGRIEPTAPIKKSPAPFRAK